MEYVRIGDTANEALRKELKVLTKTFDECAARLVNCVPDTKEARVIMIDSLLVSFTAVVLEIKINLLDLEVPSTEASDIIADFATAVASYIEAIYKHRKPI